MTLKEKYKNEKPIAYWAAGYGIKIYDIIYDIEDYIIFATFDEYDGNKFHKRKIYYNSMGGYFKYNGYYCYLCDCIKY